ncbi:ATP-binding cassette domain-containing protein [Rhizobium sp. WL3]|uniref:ATP-binding cassette domain-containing protein n=1 Tax=Rhizobium sp. WL3 TaxID=2603277 RepID=UPI0011C1E4F1|nr:ATP-binding cassette domain-containing protein [Rhizobium sp. WL3]QEE46692.1 ATP-binding cassette domain-containing protein [Rhizobium sp. WL3]
MKDYPISVRHLNHWFGRGEARKQAVFDLSIDIAPGSLTVMVGPSGSGKTTVLTLMGCLRQVEDGSVQLLGHELRGAAEPTLEALRRELGFIFQAHNLHESLTARQNVMMGLQVHGKGYEGLRVEAVEHMLDLVGLGHRLDYLPANLSGGQKQRVAIARALIAGPRVVFADEPTAALDKDSGHQVVTMLKALGRERGTTTVMVTHDSRILDMADRIVTLEEGRLVKDEGAVVSVSSRSTK